MAKLTQRDRDIRLLALLSAIKEGSEYTHKNSVLAPLAQRDLIAYDLPPKGWPAINVRLTDNGESYLSFLVKRLT